MSSTEEIEQAKKAEQIYEILKNKVATSSKVSDDIMNSFQRLTLARKKWYDEIKNLPDTDELKNVLKKQYWIEFEFGVHIDYGKDLILPKNMLSKIRKSILGDIKYYPFENFKHSPFDIFDEALLQEDVFPIPDRTIECDWDKKTLRIRYYYPNPPEISKPKTWESIIRRWWSLWEYTYHDHGFLGYILVDENEKPREWLDREDENFDEIQEESEYQTHAFISRIRTFDGKCFALGHSVFTGKIQDDDSHCVRVEQFA